MQCPISTRYAAQVVLAALTLVASTASAAETLVELDGEVPDGDERFFTLDFEVPPGTVEIEVQHVNPSASNVLDWGLVGPAGFRGWGGGNAEPAVVSVDAASRSYTPGPIEPGTWQVLVGKARIGSPPGSYDIDIFIRDEATLAPQPERMPYAPPAALAEGERWYAGDFHVHSQQSGDARPDLDEIATFARSRGLDFVVISDHNVHTALDFFGAVQPGHPELLLVPGVEFTTYAGHGNGIGATSWVDHRGALKGAIENAIDAYHDQGALFAINHPVFDLGPLCIGCAWEYDIDFATVDAVEITNGGLEPFGAQFSDAAIDYWDALCAMGLHIAPIGGSDDHKAGVELNQFQSPIGDGTTLVLADALSVEAIIEGVRSGRTVVKLQGPGDPTIEFTAQQTIDGDTIAAAAPTLEATIHNGQGAEVRLVHNGQPGPLAPIDSDPFTAAWDVLAPASGQDRYRVEVFVGGRRRVLTSHLWVEFAEPESGSSSTSAGQGSGSGTTGESGLTTASEVSSSDPGSSGQATADTDSSGSAGELDGCGCQADRHAMLLAPLWVLFLAAALGRRRRAGND